MNVNVLIDAIVRQTMILVAQLATTAGVRAPLAHMANEVFLDLTRELKRQGLGNKVIADMFGLALRSYHSKVQRLSESATFRGRSLWEAILDFIEKNGTVVQSQVLARFAADDEATVRGVLMDLVESGLVFAAGRGSQTSYRPMGPEARPPAEHDGEGFADLVWVIIQRGGSTTADKVAESLSVDRGPVDLAIERLVRDCRVSRTAAGVLHSKECVIPVGNRAGWEAAIFEHYQAVVTAMCTKLRAGAPAQAGDTVGGSTYGFTLWNGHPHEQEVLGLLGRMRAEMTRLREKVAAYNATLSEHPETFGVLAYVGQTVVVDEKKGDET
jgi:hypothetical protein